MPPLIPVQFVSKKVCLILLLSRVLCLDSAAEFCFVAKDVDIEARCMCDVNNVHAI